MSSNDSKVIETPLVLTNLFSDIGNEAEWRGQASKEQAWKDSNQWSQEQLEHFKELGLPENMFVNLMAPAMDSVTGYEAKHRVDWMLNASDESQDEMVEALNHELNDALRLADANTACSDAYGGQAGVGIGWVHVAKNSDILSPSKLIVENIHRDEMFWDMRSRSGSLRTDCRYIARRKFYDKDEAKEMLPGHKELIDFTYGDWQTIDINPAGVYGEWYEKLNEYSKVVEDEMDNVSSRARVPIYETYYKVIERRDILMTPDGFAVEFSESNPVHLEILMSGAGQLHAHIPVNITREAWFIGPNCILDTQSRAPHNEFPYVPFFGVREDASNTPQGLLRRMMGPQEEYNRAVVEIQRILRSIRIEMDDDATDGMTDQQLILEVKRADGIVRKRRGSDFRVVREWEKLNALEGICKRAREEINAASGIYQTFQGRTESAQSGVAVENIADLGAQTLGKLNANYQASRKMVGELAFYYIAEDIGVGQKTINIPSSLGQQKKSVKLNDGVNNRLAMLRSQVALQDVHTSAGYKQHTNQRLTSVMANLPDDLKTVLFPLWVETSDLPKKEFAMKLINKKLGYVEDEEQQAQIDQQRQEDEQMAKQIEIESAQATNREKESKAINYQAQAESHKADASAKRLETIKLLKELKGGAPTDPRQPSPSATFGA